MTEETYMVRVLKKLVEAYRQRYPKLNNLTATAIVDVMLRDALGKYQEITQ